MAEDPNQQQQAAYPTGVDPRLINEGEIKSDQIIEDNDLKTQEAEEHIDYIRKVLGIVTVQMIFTFALCVLSSISTPVGKFFRHPLTLILALVLFIYSFCRIAFDEKLRRTVPQNYIHLGMVTCGEAFMLAATAADLKVASVYSAIMGTCAAVGGLFLAALYTASSVDRDLLIRNMVKGLAFAFFMNLIMLLIILFAYNP